MNVFFIFNFLSTRVDDDADPDVIYAFVNTIKMITHLGYQFPDYTGG